MRAVFFDHQNLVWIEFTDIADTLVARTPEGISPLFRALDYRIAREGLHAAGFVTYEAAPGFDDKFATRGDSPETGFLPLAVFCLYRTRTEYTSLAEIRGADCPNKSWSVGPFRPDLTKDDYIGKVDRIKECLFKGDSYQVNLTFRVNARFSGDAFSWFAEIAGRKPGDYPAFIETDRFAVCSFSPELFFTKMGNGLLLKPMKGTAKPVPGMEEAQCEVLRSDGKNRAENLMIVDMIRNDAGRIAIPGTVAVPSLFETEIHPTVIQMTSTVTAKTDTALPGIFAALFPCASITGAPKIRSMEIISELEDSPRGIYTGAIGFISPGRDCRFSVAIRTAVIDKMNFSARYGTGSGIVWASEAESEWEECMTKTAILADRNGFGIFESLLLEDGAYFLLERHLERMERSCRFFGLIAGTDDTVMPAVREALAETAGRHAAGKYKIRIETDGVSAPAVDCSPVIPLPSPCMLAVAGFRVDSGDPFLRHKTTRRRHIDDAVTSMGGDAGDVILVNERGELTESTRANLVLRLDGAMVTPPLSSGLLPGVYREELLASGTLIERVLYPGDLRRAESIHVVNSVRKFLTAGLR